MKHPEILSQLTLEEKCALLSGRTYWDTCGVGHAGVPSIALSDGPHGLRKQDREGDMLGLKPSLPATCYPTAATMANSWDPDLCETLGRHLGAEAAAQGVSVLLGPGLNLKRNPLCGRNFEYFSEDPLLSGKLAAAYIRGIQTNGVAACPKHFAANNVELRRMASDSIVDERTLRELYLTGFEIAVKEGRPRAIMSAYNKVNGTYASENAHLLREILRDEWGFDGIVVTDWGACDDIAAGVRAGANLEMPGTGGDGPMALMKALRAGRLTTAELDRRVDELVDVALAAHAAVERAKDEPIDWDAHHAFAQRCAEESIVLLKNEGGILPLASGAKVAVIGEFARKPRYQGGGSSEVNATRVESTLDAIGDFDLEFVGFEPGCPRHGAPDASLIEKAVALAKRADIALLWLGLDEIGECEGYDRRDMQLPESQVKLLEAVQSANPNVVVVLSAGSAVETPWLDRCRALVHGGLGGQAGARAMLRALTGVVDPSGRLSETFPVSYEDVSSAPWFPQNARTAEYREGLYVGYRWYETADIPVAFPFGFGLSYTTFEYADLRADRQGVTFTLTNTGSRDGAEVAQLYVHAVSPNVYRPRKELKGFKKVFLKAGESREITIPLDDAAFRYFNTATNRFEVDGGDYELLVSSSARDVRLWTEINVPGTDAPTSEDPSKLACYYVGNVRNVPDSAFAALLGRDIPDGSWSKGAILPDDPVSRLGHAKSLKARLAHRVLTKRLDAAAERGRPDPNLAFMINMPIRAIGKVTGGLVTAEMCEGILTIVNGHAIAFFRGVGRIIGGWRRARRARRRFGGIQ